MRAQVLNAFGDDALFSAVEQGDPTAGPGQLLVEMAATSINPIEVKLRRHGGEVAPDLPAVLGSDLAGRVVAVGSGVERFTVGDEVFGYIGGVRGSPGAYASMVAVDSALLAFAPRSIPLAHAAALPLAGLTALDALERSGVGCGTSLLILGATGGVGQLAVQMARALGAVIHAGVRSSDKLGAALDLGADTAFSLDRESPVDHGLRVTGDTGFDVIIDCTAGIDLGLMLTALRDGGQLVSLVTRRACDLSIWSRKGLTLHAIFAPNWLRSERKREMCGARLGHIARLVDAGQLRPQIDGQTFTLDQLNKANARFESGQADGKIIISCDPPDPLPN